MNRLKALSLSFAVALAGVVAVGEYGFTSQQDAKRGRVVLRGLDNPCGIAVQPETGHVFVSLNKRIIRFSPGNKGKRSTEVRGFPTDVYGKGPMYNIGPLGLAFIDKNTLAVGGGGRKDGAELVRFYTVGAEPKEKGKATKAKDMKYKSGPIKPGAASQKGEGNFYALAVTSSAIYVTCNGDDTKGWVSRISLEGGKPGALEPFISSKEATEVDAPTAATISPDGKLVVGQLGEITVPGDSLLTMYDPKSGKLEKKLATGLSDLVALAYSATGKLYALDFSWHDTSKGGLFRLDVDGDKVTASKIASVDKPTAMVFTPEGSLLVTAIGTGEEGSKRKPGHVLLFRGL